jgi:hypothetical protein
MSTVESVNATATPTAQALAAGQANTASGAGGSQAQKMGLPPVGLAQAASANTVNAQLVSSQWGVDPATVNGVYGGAAESSGLFSGDNLLPLLTNLSHAHAEQALALIGVQTPKPGTAAGASQAETSSSAVSQAYSAQSQAALDQIAASGSGPAIVDPLWGRSA